jgi:PAS domain S-box-containing protein
VATYGVQRQVILPPTPESARAARRLVTDVLAAARAGEFLDVAPLLTSELVTNGIVHAHTELQVTVEAAPTWVRVEVVDGNPNLPVKRDYDESAVTGRGLEMVELLAAEFGVESLEDDGKRVWFLLGSAPSAPGEAGATGDDGRPAPGDDLATTTIRLEHLPVELYCAWQPHAEALLREATLAALDDPASSGGFPLANQALGALADAARPVFALRDRGVASADVVLELAAEALPWFPLLRDILARATAMSIAGQLLVPPSLPELVALRNWVCDEIARQRLGVRPTPWTDLAADDGSPLQVSPSLLDEIRNATVATVAADAANRIIAVSRPAAELLGWDGAELEGRRLVTIIPQRLRDRHIAGFTRHLLDGTSRTVDGVLEVPALRHDGSEVMIRLGITRRADPSTWAVFVATMERIV